MKRLSVMITLLGCVACAGPLTPTPTLPEWPVTVTVTHAGQPIFGATVTTDASDNDSIALTDLTGRATVSLPARGEHCIAVWKQGYARVERCGQPTGPAQWGFQLEQGVN